MENPYNNNWWTNTEGKVEVTINAWQRFQVSKTVYLSPEDAQKLENINYDDYEVRRWMEKKGMSFSSEDIIDEEPAESFSVETND